MSKRSRAGVFCFGLGFAASVGSSCFEPPLSDSCDCPKQTARPTFQGVIPIGSVSEDGEGVPTPAPGIEAGTLTVTESELTVSYTNEGAEYSVRYAIAEVF